MLPVALTIAGSDPSGGAGIQADLKTFHQFGVYGEAAITLITVQNTQRVSRVEVLSSSLVSDQIEAVVSDIKPGAAKTGALGSVEIIEAVTHWARRFDFPLVVDPVLISKHGTRLLSPDGQEAMKSLFPHATLLTPNIPEAEALTGMEIHSVNDMTTAALRLLDVGCKAVLVKGGHREGEAVDVLCLGSYIGYLRSARIQTRNTHGTGCTFSAAITACLAKGADLIAAVTSAKSFIQAAIETAVPLGSGFGPLNHFVETSDLARQRDGQK